MPDESRPPSVVQLGYFIAVAETGSYRRAADEIGVSQPAVSVQLNALETRLGVALFERSRAGTQLSPAGRTLLPQARRVVESMRQFQALSGSIATGHQTTYRLGVPPTVGPYLLPHVLPDLHRQHQALKLYVREDPHRTLLNDLDNGSFDLVIVPMPLPRTMAHLAEEPLCTESLKFVVSSDHPLAGSTHVTPSKLRGESVLTLEEQHHFHQQVHEICTRWGADVQRDYEGTSLDTLRQMVVMGMGTAFLPALYVHSELHHPRALHVLEIKGKPVTRQHALVWRATAPDRGFYRQLASDIRRIIKRRLGKALL